MNLSDIKNGQLLTNAANGLVLLDGSGNLVNSSAAVWANPNTRIIYDQFNDQAISTVSDTWNTDSSTTLISDPDYGYVAVNGSLFVRQTIQLQSFGGSTAIQLGSDGTILINGAGINTPGGLVQLDSSGNLVLTNGLQANNNIILDASGNLHYQDGTTLTDSSNNLYYHNGTALADQSGDLYYGNGNTLASSSGYLYYGNGTPLADQSGDLYYNTGTPLADSGSNLFYGSGANIADQFGDLYYGNGNTLASSSGYLYYGSGNQHLADINGKLYYGTGTALADQSGDLYYGNGNTLASSSGYLYYGNGTPLANSSGTLYYSNGNNVPVLAFGTGWTANADAGDKTVAIGSTASLTTIATALNLVSAGAGTALLNIAQKVKALESALAGGLFPNA